MTRSCLQRNRFSGTSALGTRVVCCLLLVKGRLGVIFCCGTAQYANANSFVYVVMILFRHCLHDDAHSKIFCVASMFAHNNKTDAPIIVQRRQHGTTEPKEGISRHPHKTCQMIYSLVRLVETPLVRMASSVANLWFLD